MKKLLIVIWVLAMLACSLPTPTPTPEPTATATPVVVVVTATPAPIDLGEDVVMSPPYYWMDLEILGRFPTAEIWSPVGVERDTCLYRIFEYDGESYMAIFGQADEKWELVDVVKIGTPTPSEYLEDA